MNAVNVKLVVDTHHDVGDRRMPEVLTLIQSAPPAFPGIRWTTVESRAGCPRPSRCASFRRPNGAATKHLPRRSRLRGAWLELFDQIVRFDATTTEADRPVQEVFGRFTLMEAVAHPALR